jgi:hypothetical protein
LANPEADHQDNGYQKQCVEHNEYLSNSEFSARYLHMKMPKIKAFPAIRMPQPPGGHALKAGRAVLGQFAHHAPATVKAIPRMSRPGKAHGPHN